MKKVIGLVCLFLFLACSLFLIPEKEKSDFVICLFVMVLTIKKG